MEDKWKPAVNRGWEPVFESYCLKTGIYSPRYYDETCDHSFHNFHDSSILRGFLFGCRARPAAGYNSGQRTFGRGQGRRVERQCPSKPARPAALGALSRRDSAARDASGYRWRTNTVAADRREPDP